MTALVTPATLTAAYNSLDAAGKIAFQKAIGSGTNAPFVYLPPYLAAGSSCDILVTGTPGDTVSWALVSQPSGSTANITGSAVITAAGYVIGDGINLGVAAIPGDYVWAFTFPGGIVKKTVIRSGPIQCADVGDVSMTPNSGVNSVFATLTVPRTGVISMSCNVAVTPTSGTLDGTVLIGGLLLSLNVRPAGTSGDGEQVCGSTSYMYNPTPNTGGWILSGLAQNGYYFANAGDIITAYGLLVWQGTASNPWSVIRTTPGVNNISAQYSKLAFHYV